MACSRPLDPRSPDTFRLCASTTGPWATRALAAGLASCLQTGDLLVLTGDLGAGKTCFAQGLGAGLAVAEPITSPTFTLVSRYEGRLVLNHLDVYRLDDPSETTDLDLPELLEDGVTVIEWGERIHTVLPTQRLTIELRFPPLADPTPGHDDLAPPGWSAPPDGRARDLSAGEPGLAGGAGSAGDDALAGDDRRELWFELVGPSWVERSGELEAALGGWRVPC
jgi:tRNA threonylcarbamoyladenosine biosynthesis protein TsaE